jgi:putative endonuclease
VRNLKIKTYYVYILSSLTGTLYIGVTNDLNRRLWEHKHKLVKGFTERYNIDRLMFYQEFSQIEEAIEIEKKIKKWGRKKKIDLIKTINPDFRDLSEN